jgi:serine/threonine protein kinase
MTVNALAERFPEFSSFRICGRGSVSTVYSAIHEKSQFPIAIKQIHKAHLTSATSDQPFDFELNSLRTLDHPFICRCFWVDESPDSFFVLNEYCSNGTLLTYLNRGKSTLSDILRIFIQLASAIYFLHHNRNLVHRDIKIENVLFDDFMNVRLIDFGFSKPLTDIQPQLRTVCGSYPYCAPEVFQGLPYGKPVDIWSLGIVLFAMVYGRLPFSAPTPAGLMETVVRDEPSIPPESPPMITDLVTRMLRKDPARRMTIEEVAQHPWIRASVFSVYFEKGYISSMPSGIPRTEAAVFLERLHLDPLNLMIEGSEEWILGQIMARKKLAEWANPENAIGKVPPIVERQATRPPALEVAPEGGRKSLLEMIGQSTGLPARRAVLGSGRLIVRPTRRQSASLLTISRMDVKAQPLAPSDSET